MANKNELISAIHTVEGNKYSRIASLIIEHYLSGKLKESLFRHGYAEAQTGWVIEKLALSSNIEKSSEDENWYRLISPTTPLTSVDEAVIGTFSRTGRHFFSVEYKNLPIDFNRKKFNIKVTELFPLNKTTSTPTPIPSLQTKLDAYIADKNFTTAPNRLLTKWFHHFDIDDLYLVFLQRCIMNSMENCVDIDAIALCTNKEKLTLLEFKRKYPASGACTFPDRFTNTFQNVSSVVAYITTKMNEFKNSLINVQDYEEKSKLLKNKFNQLCSSKNINKYNKIPEEFYCGLDWSHYQILKMCNEVNVTYKYLIWNFNPCNIVREEKKSEKYENDILNQLLDLQSFKHKHHSFLYATLSHTDAKGLTFTEGSDSGALTKDVRLQVIFSLKPKQKSTFVT